MESPVRLPRPKFFTETEQLSTKKAKRESGLCTPRDRPPPKLTVRSSVLVSRLLRNHLDNKAHAVSFTSNGDDSLCNKNYDESKKDSYFNQCFSIISLLGEGSFGRVYKVQNKEDGMFYAVKKSKERFRGNNDRKIKLEEVKKHEFLPKHPNCVEFVKAWEERNRLYIQTELCETSLSIFADQNDSIPEKQIWVFLIDIIQAVKHLHDNNFLHLDIKPANIFISSNGMCKLGDFGLVFDLTKGDLSDAIEGDPKYLAPEVMEGKFTKAADIFSLGITFLELACDLDLPRGGEHWHRLRNGDLPHQFMKDLSPGLKSILTSMMHPFYNERPTADQLLKNVLISEVPVIKWRQSEIRLYSNLKNVSINKKNMSTPENPSLNLDEFWSDEELDQSSMLNESLIPGVLNLSNISTESDENKGFILGNLERGPLLNSTPTKVNQRSRILRRFSNTCSPKISSSLHLNSSCEFEPEKSIRFNITPKNLLESLNSISDDDLPYFSMEST